MRQELDEDIRPAGPAETEFMETLPAGPSRASRKRNYWARIDPQELLLYPDFEPLPYRQEVRLIQRAQAGDEEARNEIWLRNARLAFAVVNRFHVPPSLLPDAVQEGVLGLKRAIEKFEVERYHAFSTYAWYWVYQAVQRFLHNRRHLVRFPDYLRKPVYSRLHGEDNGDLDEFQHRTVTAIIAALNPVPLSEIPPELHPLTGNSPGMNSLERKQFVRRVRVQLPEREFFVIKHRFGLQEARPKTLEAIAKRMGITRERVRQLESRAIDRLKQRLPQDFAPVPRSQPKTVQAENHSSEPARVNGHRPPSLQTQPEPDLSDQELEELLLNIFKHFTFRQANALIHYYGLCCPREASVHGVADLLNLPPRKTLLALRKGRKKLLAWLSRYQYPKVREIRRTLAQDRSLDIEIS